MESVFTTVLGSLNIFLLILFRMLGLFLISPLFGRSNSTPLFKISFCIVLSYILLPSLSGQLPATLGFMELLGRAVREVMLGLGMGFTAQLIFLCFVGAGALIDMDMGLSMAQSFDPTIGDQIGLSSRLLDVFAFLIFLTVNGHHILIKTLLNSFYVLPLNGTVMIHSGFLEFLIKLFSYIMVSAVTLAIPITISAFLANLLLAFMAKIMPQMNVFIVGMPFKIFLGLVIFSFSLPYMAEMFKKIFLRLYEFLYFFVNAVRV